MPAAGALTAPLDGGTILGHPGIDHAVVVGQAPWTTHGTRLVPMASVHADLPCPPAGPHTAPPRVMGRVRGAQSVPRGPPSPIPSERRAGPPAPGDPRSDPPVVRSTTGSPRAPRCTRTGDRSPPGRNRRRGSYHRFRPAEEPTRPAAVPSAPTSRAVAGQRERHASVPSRPGVVPATRSEGGRTPRHAPSRHRRTAPRPSGPPDAAGVEPRQVPGRGRRTVSPAGGRSSGGPPCL